MLPYFLPCGSKMAATLVCSCGQLFVTFQLAEAVQVTGSPELLLLPFLTEMSSSTELLFLAEMSGSPELLLLLFFSRVFWQPRTSITSFLTDVWQPRTSVTSCVFLLFFFNRDVWQPSTSVIFFFYFLTEMSGNPELL